MSEPGKEPVTGPGPTWAVGLLTAVVPGPDRPGAAKVLVTDSAQVVAFSFRAGQVLAEHATHHAAIVQCLSGLVSFEVAGQERELTPGDLVHLPPRMRHAVRALEDSVITVTMLLAAPAADR